MNGKPEKNQSGRFSQGTRIPLCEGILLRVPVVQATLGVCDGPRLASAVSQAGALGTLTLHDADPLIARRRLAHVRRLTRRPVLIAFTAQWEKDEVLSECIAAGFRYFQTFWWNTPRLARRIHAEGGILFSQVGSADQAKDAMDFGADVLIAQGTEAGGQVRTAQPLETLLEELLAVTSSSIPLVAGGGLATKNDVTRVLSSGANAALLGTRFLLSEEAAASPHCKARLVRADTDDLTLDTRIIGDWPCAPRRRLLTERSADIPALYAGSGLSAMRSLLPAAEIVRSLAP